MNTNFLKKSIECSVIATIVIVFSVLTGCQSDLLNDVCCANFTTFEKTFAKSLSSDKDAVRLIGFKTYIIEKDRILLKNEFIQQVKNGVKSGYSIDGNACIFDFKVLTSMNESCCSNTTECGVPRLKSGTEFNISCIQNHGGKNCSDAFGIWGDNCVTKRDRCMDYNGFFSDCSGSKAYYLGSDCNIAMILGNCWNEL